MKAHLLALAAVSAYGIVPLALSHELAFSKTEQIHVIVEGEANNWCKPDVAITVQRPTWDGQKPLLGLLGKLPFILTQECPSAKYTWKAVDAQGATYASGAGSANNLGLVTLAATPAPSAASPESGTAPLTVEPVATAPATPVGAPVASPPPAPVEQAASVPVQEMATPAVAPVTPIPVAPVPQAAIVAAPSADFGRSVVAANSKLTVIADGSGCKWIISKTAVDESDPSTQFTSSPAMPCGVSGFAVGAFDTLRWSVPNTHRGDTWSKTYVHPSGLMFSQSLSSAVKDKALSFLSNNADEALFKVGEIPARGMKVYLAFPRSSYNVLSPFSSNPYYVGITEDERFALNPADLKRTAVEVFQLVKATSPTTIGLKDLYFAKSLESLYTPHNYADENGIILRSRMGENRGEFFFDAREGQNYTKRREENRQRDLRRQQQQMAELHRRVLTRYEQIKEGMKDRAGHETEVLAQMLGIKVTFPTPVQLFNPSSASTAVSMMIHVTGKDDDFYEIDFPRRGRLQSDVELENQWYVVQAANLTPFLALEDRRAVPTFRVYAMGVPEPCAQDRCADRVSFGAVLQKEFPDAGIDFSWTRQSPSSL